MLFTNNLQLIVKYFYEETEGSFYWHLSPSEYQYMYFTFTYICDLSLVNDIADIFQSCLYVIVTLGSSLFWVISPSLFITRYTGIPASSSGSKNDNL